MRDLVTDIEEIARLAEKRRDENFEFRAFLKGELEWSDRRLDSLVREIAERVSDQVDCTACANCCRTTSVTVSDPEIKRLARRLGITAPEFEAHYVLGSDCGDKIVDAKPCPFLEGSLCSLYEDRPRDCRDFPHLHKTGFRSRTLGVIDHVELCPIVFNTWKLLKEHFRFGDRYAGANAKIPSALSTRRPLPPAPVSRTEGFPVRLSEPQQRTKEVKEGRADPR